MHDHETDTETIDVEPPLPLGHAVHTIRNYSRVIWLTLAAVAVGYTIVAIAIYLLSPSYRLTSQTFRLDFEGASRGTYPNGTKFSTAEIVSTPILLKAFTDNHLDRFTSPQDFVRSVFVLEWNPEYELMAADYQARLADPKLTPVDRERLKNEWELRSASLAKSDHSINYLRGKDSADIPESVVRKVLNDILIGWANFVAHEQHVLAYDVSVLSPEIVADTPQIADPLLAVQVLRMRTIRVLLNIEQLRNLPAADLVRTKQGKLALGDIQVRLEDLLRFHLEPLVTRILDTGASSTQQETIRMIETQLAYDERRLVAQKDNAEAIRQALLAYTGSQSPTTNSRERGEGSGATGDGETVMPQLSDSFIDRLVTLATNSTDLQYRQVLVDKYREASLAIIPLQQAVIYSNQVLARLRNQTRPSSTQTTEEITKKISASREETRQLVVAVNEIYNAVSANLNPSTHLFTITAPAVTRVERAVSGIRLALLGILICVAMLPVTVFLSLLHSRIREEETEESVLHERRERARVQSGGTNNHTAAD